MGRAILSGIFTVAVMTECSVGSVQGKLRFPQVLQKLGEIGVESYHADLYRKEKTYYMPNRGVAF
jgi:hypothetical protein